MNNNFELYYEEVRKCSLLRNYKFLIESQEKVANNNQNIESDRTM